MTRVRRKALGWIAALSCVASLCFASPPNASIDSNCFGASLADSGDGPAQHLVIVPGDASLLAVASRSGGDGGHGYVRLRVHKRVRALRRAASSWQRGAAFDRGYVPVRLRRILAPPSASDPDLPS